MTQRTAIIIGAGPAGLTAAHELLKTTDIRPLVFELSDQVGGIAKTVNYKGNRIDIGGHRFFSKSPAVVKWWTDILPLQGAPAKDDRVLQREAFLSKEPGAPDPERTDKVMLVRRRLSRIFAFQKFFDYPVTLSLNTLASLGVVRVVRILVSYLKARLFPVRQEKSLEDFLINRFGRELYVTFFKSYTEKIWGVKCREISAEWGAQRIRGLSIRRAIEHAVSKILFPKDASLTQKGKETSLIEQFMYPKLGPGHLWEAVARRVQECGGEIRLNHEVIGVTHRDGKLIAVQVRDRATGRTAEVAADYVLSSMPVKELMAAMTPTPPAEVKRVAGALLYRDFITVGVLLKRLKIKNTAKLRTVGDIVPDNWIYVQDDDVKLGRVQIFNNWSPYLVKDEKTVWVGLEYFCQEGDELWSRSESEMASFAAAELVKIGFIGSHEDVADSVVLRVAKTYPSYVGIYPEFPIVRQYTDQIKNLFLIGRNGMHRYNNMDHSMMTAMVAVENIANGVTAKDNIWAVNLEKEYHE